MKFKKKFNGYRPEQVENYFTSLEQDHQEVINKKLFELIEIRRKNNELISIINTLSEEIEEHNKKKMQVINKFSSELVNFDNIKQKTEEEAYQKKLAALQKLKNLRDELLGLNKLLNDCYKDLSVIKHKYQFLQ